jgi:DNA-binding NarL/FixJ family response regulator
MGDGAGIICVGVLSVNDFVREAVGLAIGRHRRMHCAFTSAELLACQPYLSQLHAACIVVVDLDCNYSVPGEIVVDADGVIRQLLRWRASVRILVLTHRLSVKRIAHLLRSYVAGLVLKGDHLNELPHAIQRVEAGCLYVSPPMRQQLLDVQVIPPLSRTELEVVQALARWPNATHAEIAKAISVVPVTVTMAIGRLKERFGVGSAIQIVRTCVEMGVVDGRYEMSQFNSGPS